MKKIYNIRFECDAPHYVSSDEAFCNVLKEVLLNELGDESEYVIIKAEAVDKNHKIAVLERALKLACECVNTTYAKPFGNDVDYTNYFIDQAEKELKDETL